jgi:hypothetical protein
MRESGIFLVGVRERRRARMGGQHSDGDVHLYRKMVSHGIDGSHLVSCLILTNTNEGHHIST